VVSALFNYNLKGNPLSHSIKVAEAKIVIYDSDLGSVSDYFFSFPVFSLL
jgi:hypothetical protein